MFKIFLKWYKNGGRGNGGFGFACVWQKVHQVALFPTTKKVLRIDKSIVLEIFKPVPLCPIRWQLIKVDS